MVFCEGVVYDEQVNELSFVRHAVNVRVFDDHNEAVHAIHCGIRRKALPFAGISIVHLDSHPDLCSTAGVDSEVVWEPRRLQKTLTESPCGIAEWILPLVYAGHVDRVWWVHGEISKQLPDGRKTLVIGRRKCDGRLCVDSRLPYWAWDGQRCERSKMGSRSIESGSGGSDGPRPVAFHLECCTVREGEARDLLSVPPQPPEAGEQPRPFVLDICLDTFCCANPFMDELARESLLPRPEVFAAVEGITENLKHRVEEEERERRLARGWGRRQGEAENENKNELRDSDEAAECERQFEQCMDEIFASCSWRQGAAAGPVRALCALLVDDGNGKAMAAVDRFFRLLRLLDTAGGGGADGGDKLHSLARKAVSMADLPCHPEEREEFRAGPRAMTDSIGARVDLFARAISQVLTTAHPAPIAHSSTSVTGAAAGAGAAAAGGGGGGGVDSGGGDRPRKLFAKRPALVTIACSHGDGYTPRDRVRPLLSRVLARLGEMFGAPLHVHFDESVEEELRPPRRRREGGRNEA